MTPRPEDALHMAHALRLAARGLGNTWPNPAVGCVIVKDGLIVGRGWTQPGGRPHAEVRALEQAGDAARGATAYVTLEPCAHHGHTPPCAEALIAAQVARVVTALTDPDPRVSGKGHAMLRAAGIAATEGVLTLEATRLNAGFLKRVTQGLPFVTLKLAASLDGRTATQTGESRWITGPEARLDAHRLRADSDAVLVGAGTVRADDPELTVRLPPDETPPVAPRRIVLGEIPAGARVEPATSYRGELPALLDGLGRDGVVQLMVEGGAAVAGAFHREGLVDRYVLYLAPALFGGDDARSLFAGAGAPTIADVWRGRIDEVTRLGGDLRVDLRPDRHLDPAASPADRPHRRVA